MRRLFMATWEALALRLNPLFRGDANTIEQHNGTTSQVNRLYATRTSATDYEALKTYFDSGNGAFRFEAEKGAAGGGFRRIFIVVSGGIYQFNDTSLRPPGDNATALGDSSNYWSLIFGADYVVRSGGRIRFAGAARLFSPANGIFQIKDDSENAGSGTFQFDPRNPSTITSNQNNYSVPVPGYFVRLSSDASRDITGIIVGASNRDGQVHRIINVGTNPINFPHDDSGSTATNRIYCSTGAAISLTSTATAKEGADIIYDGTLQRWLMYKL